MSSILRTESNVIWRLACITTRSDCICGSPLYNESSLIEFIRVIVKLEVDERIEEEGIIVEEKICRIETAPVSYAGIRQGGA
jgi:hypothetical protein